jgi:hypothetical protein
MLGAENPQWPEVSSTIRSVRRTTMRTTLWLAACVATVFLAAASAGLAQSTSPSTSSPEAGTEGTATSPPMTQSEREAQSRLEAAGYTRVRDVKSSKEGTSAKAMKDGKEVELVIDSDGKVMKEMER